MSHASSLSQMKASPLRVSLLLAILVSASVGSMAPEAVVAVYEHKPVGDPSTDTPLQLMRKNTEIYKSAAKQAAASGAELLVFPEYGVYATAEYTSRATLLPYLQEIPVSWTPCQPTDIVGSEILLDLSCIAKTHSLTVVANIGTVAWCSHQDDRSCPADGRYQYNTNVVFDKNGQLITMYHKVNLYGEKNFDKPTLKHVTFRTGFGTLGVATCFDLLFKQPAIGLVEDHGAQMTVLPTYWFNRIPFLAMYEYAEAWAVRMKTYLLVANIHSPSTAHVGSGIFGPEGVVNYTYVTDALSRGQLVTARIQLNSVTTHVPSAVRTNVNHSSRVMFTSPQPFTTVTNGDTFNYVKIHPEHRRATVCQQGLCCTLKYYLSPGSLPGNANTEFFALGAFSGVHTTNYTLCNQVCAVVRCTSTYDCGDGIVKGYPGFRHLHLQGNFTSGTYRFPTVLDDNARPMKRLDGSWSFSETEGLRYKVNHSAKPLVFGIYGRCFDRDP